MLPQGARLLAHSGGIQHTGPNSGAYGQKVRRGKLPGFGQSEFIIDGESMVLVLPTVSSVLGGGKPKMTLGFTQENCSVAKLLCITEDFPQL